MLRSLFYVSTSTLSLPGDGWQVAEIVKFSRIFNAKAGITGALIFTEQNFAQFLEGPEQEISALLQRLERDTRHADLDVVLDNDAAQRRFPGWTMAYSGPHVFVADQFSAFAAPSRPVVKRRAAERLIETMVVLAAADGRTCN